MAFSASVAVCDRRAGHDQMDTVFLLHHVREYDDSEDVKLIGVFRSYGAAERARDAVRDEAGFRDFPWGFSIDEHQLDRAWWTDGFIFDDEPETEGPLRELSRCVARGELLRSVHELTVPELAKSMGYVLEFDTKPLTIFAEPTDGTVRVLADRSPFPRDAQLWRTGRGAFSSVVGKRLREGSLLVTSRGYVRGVQLDFMLQRFDSMVTIQIVAGASRLDVVRVE